MSDNSGAKGGCLQIVDSELLVVHSSFVGNKALQGGVIFAIQRAVFRVEDSELYENIADDGGVLYGMAN